MINWASSSRFNSFKSSAILASFSPDTLTPLLSVILLSGVEKMLILLLLLFLSPTTPTLSLSQDGLYLLQVKLQLSDPTESLSSWNPRDDTPCNWFGISCDPRTGRVNSVILPNSQLAGPFPIFLCRLPSISNITLVNNSINSTLSTVDFSICQSLQYLDLSENLLVGPLPPSLADMPNLRFLNLSGNNFSGDIPASFGHFPKLEYLILFENLLNGSIPNFLGNISTLKELRIAYNPFAHNSIPSELGNLTNLEYLWLAGCNLVGTIPTSLTKLPRLTNLDLSENGLTGSIPTSIIELKSIIQIELYNNALSGVLPEGLSNLTNLRRFDLSMNQLTGTIPDELCRLPLESLNLYENRFEGSLPESIALSPNLYELKLFNNKLTGQLPSEIGKNSGLQSLDVSYNEFSGEIPATLCEHGVLVDLILIYNSFSGKIPESLGKCLSLNRARLRNNKLSGNVPEAFWGLPHLYLLEVVENSLSGEISKSISGANNLSVLLISRNQFSGSIPEEIGFLDNLLEFSGSNNKLTGTIPRSIVNLSQLGKLDLSNNGLSGQIPLGIHGWKKLNELNLANNELDGEIPDEIGSLPGLNFLDLSGNYFSGVIPTGLQNLKLNLLNLSNNQLSGDIPGLYANENYRTSFLGNPGLCGDLPGLCTGLGESKRQHWIFRSIILIASIVFVTGLACFYMKYRKFKKMKEGHAMTKWKSFHKLGFSEFEVVKCLDEDNVIGAGASGKVYKVTLSNSEVVAVKKLWRSNKKENRSEESEKDGFEVEVETLGKIRHKNIVRLWCCCISGESKLLVYEYMPNGSLGDLLHGNKGGLLDWPTRYRISLDAAEGLAYLHHDCVPPIVHRDVKSNNILIDAEFGAKVADFGVAKIFRGATLGAESMSVVAGSWGYIAPEYAYTLRVNEKSDIYSFGVVLLELITGKPPVGPEYGEMDLVKWVCTTLEQKDVDHVIDSNLDSIYKEEICKVLNIGLHCTSSLPINRPSMRKVVKMLQEAVSNGRTKTVEDGRLSPYYN